jgi:hypothetical protein
VITSRVVTVYASTLLASSQEPVARAQPQSRPFQFCLLVFNIECAKRLKIALEVCIWGGFQRFALGMLQIRVKVNSHIDAD